MDRVPQPDAGVKALGRFLARILLAGVLLYGGTLAIVVTVAFAEERCTWVSATLASKHLSESKSGKDYNERNYGLGGENCLGTFFGVPVRGAAGVFRNSNRVDSLYVGGSATFLELGPVALGAAALLVSGYAVEPVKAIFPVMAIEGSKLGANISWFPKTKDNVSALGLQLKWRWR